jgi:hypothetical protein
MKKAWKWFLGILIVLLVVAALVAVPLAMHTYMASRVAVNTQQQQQAPQAPQGFNGGPMMGHGNMPGFNNQGREPGGFDGRGGPMMGGGFGRNSRRGFGPFGFGMMFFGGLLRLIPLALFGLLLYGVYQLGKRAGLRAAPAAVSPAPSAPAPAPHLADAPQDDQTPAA